ncbi:LPS sulfotransferase NodH [Labrenzia sp. EL_126]|nr:LPS sulfotransferase NodH [Labrenzia sp. EL_126]
MGFMAPMSFTTPYAQRPIVEKAAVQLVNSLCRAIKKKSADPFSVKRAQSAEDWLKRYHEKYPGGVLREGAVLSDDNSDS